MARKEYWFYMEIEDDRGCNHDVDCGWLEADLRRIGQGDKSEFRYLYEQLREDEPYMEAPPILSFRIKAINDGWIFEEAEQYSQRYFVRADGRP